MAIPAAKHRRRHGLKLRALGGFCVLLLGVAVAAGAGSAAPEAQAVAVLARPIVPAGLWKRMETARTPPAILRELSAPGLHFSPRGAMPVARLDGSVTNHRLPPVLWLKLEQPGTTLLVIETPAGKFFKVLEEVAPGFVSRCALDSYGFGTLEGEAVHLDRANLPVTALWIIQDASAAPHQAPGWFAVAPDAAAPEFPGESLASAPENVN